MNIGEMRFLVVQNDAFERNRLRILLAGMGATRIIEADDGPAALRLMQDPVQQIDIGFIDLHTPIMDGMELIRHMARTERDTAIVMSGVEDPALEFTFVTLSKAYDVNLLGFVQRPTTDDKLGQLIKRYTPRLAYACDTVTEVREFSIGDIMLALASDQIAPYFQPKVALATGRVQGAEAFARWHHPELGMILPHRFIPVLEKYQQLDQLTTAMIEKSITACRLWHDAGYLISVSINLGSTLLGEADIADRIADQVAAHRLEPRYVTFEITESAASNEQPAALENMVRLRLKGFELSVDDYGTGHASMQQLLRIPFSELKIDRSFVAGAALSESLGVVLGASIELAGKLEKSSVAVGIESREDWELLKKMGCTCGQGYYIARPMAATALPDWMREWGQFF